MTKVAEIAPGVYRVSTFSADYGMQFNQFLLTPYIGDGSPVDQYMWVDDLVVATSRP